MKHRISRLALILACVWNTAAGGPDAGGPDAGGPDAGGPDAGGPDAGSPDAGSPEAAGPDAAQRLQALLEDINTVVSDFEQTTINADNRVVQENSGRLWVESPAKFRIETTTPFAQTLVSDGADFWTFDEELEQVMIRKLERDVAEVPILLFGGQSGAILEAYEVSAVADDTGQRFVLTPRGNEGLFESMTLHFAAGRPERIRIQDSLGQRTRIDLVAPVLNQPITSARFTLDVPEGVDVVDDRVPAHAGSP